MFEFSMPQSQSVLPVDLHEQVLFDQNTFLAETVEDAQFPLPKKFVINEFIGLEPSISGNGDATFPPPKK